MKAAREALLLRSVLLGLRGADVLRRRAAQLSTMVEAAALAGLSNESLRRLTVAVYDRMGSYRNEKGLFAWEQEWFAADLPAPPARLLVGGAGSGREIAALSAAGYPILAFDPAPRLVRHARGLTPSGPVEIFEAGYEELALGANPGSTGFEAAIARVGAFDAVILGWGSFAHVSVETTRIRLLERLRLLCPLGPLLLSFMVRAAEPPPAPGRAARIGAVLGRSLASPARTGLGSEAGDVVYSHAGFVHLFSWAEISTLAARCGYTVHRSSQADPGVYPHATLRPVTTGDGPITPEAGPAPAPAPP